MIGMNRPWLVPGNAFRYFSVRFFFIFSALELYHEAKTGYIVRRTTSMVRSSEAGRVPMNSSTVLSRPSSRVRAVG
jgi:hypothetical protein